MSGLTLDFEWIDPAGAKGRELRATWARLEIKAGDHSVTRVIDQSSRSVRNSLFLPLYPLAEWLTTHWWFLLHEIETLGRSTSDQYGTRHDLRHGAEGFALPSLTMQPLGEEIRLDWRPVLCTAQNLEFTASGSTSLPSSELRQRLADFISAVVERLQLQGVEGTLLEQEWRSIQEAEPDESAFCIAAASLGIDPYALDEQGEQDLLTAGKCLPASVLPDFFSVADWPTLVAQARQVRDALETSRGNRVDLKSIKHLKRELSTAQHQGSPWDQGYLFARQLRRHFHPNGERLNSFSSLSRALDIPLDDLEAAIITIPGLPGSLDALVATNSLESPGFAIPEHRRDEAVRFAFCRALFEYLTVREGEPLLVTRARSNRQKRNRAFAAELLVPADLLQEALPRQVIGEDETDELAAVFGVSPSVIRHQIENHGLATFSD
jgi:hypothetical protein